jgi:hypothetical protein
MKIANTADWQLKGKDLHHADAQLAALIAECIARGVRIVNVVGDIFERSTIHDEQASTGAVLRVALKHTKALTDAGIHVVFVKGNHDQAGAGSADALHAFDGLERVRVAHDPGVFTVEGVHLICLPWSYCGGDPEAIITQLIDACPKTLPRLLLPHCDVIGMKMNASRTNERSACPLKPGTWQVRREFLEGLPVDHIAGGHYHLRQPFFIGALYQNNWGEEGNPAGFEIFDTETGAVEWVELDAAPRYHSEMIAVCDDGRDHQFTTEGLNGDNWRVRFDGNPDPVEIRRLEAAGVRVEIVVEAVERIRRAEVPEGIADDNHALIGLWATSQNPPVDGARLERMHRVLDATFADKQADLIAEAGKMVAEPQAELVASASEGSPF